MTLNDLKWRNSPYFAFFADFDFFAGQIRRSGWIQTYIVHKYCLSVPVFHFWPLLTHPAARSLCDSWATCLLLFYDSRYCFVAYLSFLLLCLSVITYVFIDDVVWIKWFIKEQILSTLPCEQKDSPTPWTFVDISAMHANFCIKFYATVKQ